MEKKHNALKRFALYKGASEQMAEDFAQHCVCLFLEGKRHPNTPGRYLYIDFIRLAGNKVLDPLPRIDEKTEPDLPLTKIPKELPIQERVALILTASWGFSFEEVAHVLGISPRRVRDMLKHQARSSAP